MSDHNRDHGRGHGTEVALIGAVIGWIVLRDGAGPLAHAIAEELTSGIPFVDLPFKLLMWAWDSTAGDIRRELLDP